MFHSDFDSWFRNDLSETGKVIATMRFMQGYAQINESLELTTNKILKKLPPFHPDIQELNLLHQTTMTKYFKVYNDILRSNRDVSEIRTRYDFRTVTEIINKICGV